MNPFVTYDNSIEYKYTNKAYHSFNICLGFYTFADINPKPL